MALCRCDRHAQHATQQHLQPKQKPVLCCVHFNAIVCYIIQPHHVSIYPAARLSHGQQITSTQSSPFPPFMTLLCDVPCKIHITSHALVISSHHLTHHHHNHRQQQQRP